MHFLNKLNPNYWKFDVKNKEQNTRYIINTFLRRTLEIFKYENLPETIPQKMIEMYLQMTGHCAFIQHDGEFYVVIGGLGGEPDVYYRPTIYTVANPALKFAKSYKIDEDCILLKNDSLYTGLLPIFQKYASLISENELSLKMSIINARYPYLISAADDRTKISGDEFLRKIEKGDTGVISDSKFFEGIKIQSSPSGEHTIQHLIDLEQYLRATLFHELGINSNFNMKRERLNSSETELNEYALLPLIDNMYESRLEAVEKINKMFGLDIKVNFNSVWKNELEDNAKTEEEIDEKNSEKEEIDENGGDDVDEAKND